MTSSDRARLKREKSRLRREALDRRNAQPDKDDLSRRIGALFEGLPEAAGAATVMYYVAARSEVRTRHILSGALNGGRRAVVPWCDGDDLRLFRLESLDELATGMWSILEPREELRRRPERGVDVREIDLVIVPGVAFDDRGARLGNGRGYYDRLLRGARPDTLLVALAYECQMVPEVPAAPHDIFMDRVVTEQRIHEGRGRGKRG